MISAIILILHGLAAIYGFVVRYRKEGLAEGFLAVGFVGLIFSVGWTISTMITGLVFEPEGLAKWMNRDTISLVLLTLMEVVFYSFFLRGSSRTGHAA